jgi:hypothetical protein
MIPFGTDVGDALMAFGAFIVVMVLALVFGLWFEQGGKSKDEDYDDD